MAKYLYKLRSNVCKCGHRKGKHREGIVRPCEATDDCKCEDLYLEEYSIEADDIRAAISKLGLKEDDVAYTYKYKL